MILNDLDYVLEHLLLIPVGEHEVVDVSVGQFEKDVGDCRLTPLHELSLIIYYSCFLLSLVTN